MTAATDEATRDEPTKVFRRPPEVMIVRDVLSRLGEPDDLHEVQARRTYGDKYRVNVYVRAASSGYRVAHSYLVAADGDGKVLASSPTITRSY
jgi:hypothetical protein